MSVFLEGSEVISVRMNHTFSADFLGCKQMSKRMFNKVLLCCKLSVFLIILGEGC